MLTKDEIHAMAQKVDDTLSIYKKKDKVSDNEFQKLRAFLKQFPPQEIIECTNLDIDILRAIHQKLRESQIDDALLLYKKEDKISENEFQKLKAFLKQFPTQEIIECTNLDIDILRAIHQKLRESQIDDALMLYKKEDKISENEFQKLKTFLKQFPPQEIIECTNLDINILRAIHQKLEEPKKVDNSSAAAKTQITQPVVTEEKKQEAKEEIFSSVIDLPEFFTRPEFKDEIFASMQFSDDFSECNLIKDLGVVEPKQNPTSGEESTKKRFLEEVKVVEVIDERPKKVAKPSETSSYTKQGNLSFFPSSASQKNAVLSSAKNKPITSNEVIDLDAIDENSLEALIGISSTPYNPSFLGRNPINSSEALKKYSLDEDKYMSLDELLSQCEYKTL
ncbi:hypothetical protein [Legionella gresilensis]|uniref:hypothetical protein n=1 Tax=Legionella gresilensis TaxID=91823 RepID=UPI00104168C8|nr:hypothetical protein [Legionella gresilensis]